MTLPTEILQMLGSSIDRNGVRKSSRSYTDDLVGMAFQHVERLPSLQKAHAPCHYPSTAADPASLHYRKSFLHENGIGDYANNQNTIDLYASEGLLTHLRLLWDTLPELHAQWVLPAFYVLFFLLPLTYLEAFLKIIGAFFVGCLKENLRSWRHMFLLIPISLCIASVGQIFYWVANTLSSVRYIIDGVLNLVFTCLAHALDSCFCTEIASFRPTLSTSFNAIGKNLLMFLPSAFLIASFFLFPLPGLISGMFTSGVVGELSGVSSSITVLSLGAFASQILSGGCRWVWESIEKVCCHPVVTDISFDGFNTEDHSNEMDPLTSNGDRRDRARTTSTDLPTSYVPSSDYTPRHQLAALRGVVSTQLMLGGSSTDSPLPTPIKGSSSIDFNRRI